VARAKTPSTSFQPRPSEAEAAYLALQPEIEAIRAPLRAQVDVQLASAIAHSVALRDQEPERMAAFERLAAAELYDLGLPERITRLALATWFTRQRQLGLLAIASNASVPRELLRSAQLQRSKMMKVLDHWLDDDPGVVAELAFIRPGTGYQDLANDLEALADIYQRPTVHAVIARDDKHFDRHDAKSARQLAKAIFQGLGIGRGSDAKRWTTLCHGSWTLLVRDYDEHRAAGVFLFRTVEEVSETYPSLVAAARRPQSPRLMAREREDDGGGGGIDEDDESTAPAAELPEAANG
jgi:hypothetical protein